MRTPSEEKTMNLSPDNIIWNAQDWWDISLEDACQYKSMTTGRPTWGSTGSFATVKMYRWASDIAHRRFSVRLDLAGKFANSTPYFWNRCQEALGKDPEPPDTQAIECVARVIERLAECHLAGETPDIFSLYAVINFATSEFEASRT